MAFVDLSENLDVFLNKLEDMRFMAGGPTYTFNGQELWSDWRIGDGVVVFRVCTDLPNRGTVHAYPRLRVCFRSAIWMPTFQCVQGVDPYEARFFFLDRTLPPSREYFDTAKGWDYGSKGSKRRIVDTCCRPLTRRATFLTFRHLLFLTVWHLSNVSH